MEKKSQTKNKKNQSKLKPKNNGVEPEVLIVPSSSSDSLNKDEEEEAKRSDITNLQSDKAKETVKKKKKKKEEERDKSKSDTNSESLLYTFPMNRINRIIKGEDSDIRVTQEAVFLINKASEKFLELFCKEVYACSVMDHKKFIGYQHLSSVVGKRRRFDFLSDFVPEQVKAEDALKEATPADT